MMNLANVTATRGHILEEGTKRGNIVKKDLQETSPR